MSEWQPIETAPKDGTVIDLWRVSYKIDDPTKPTVNTLTDRVANCYWDRDHWVAKMPSGCGLLVEQGWAITHWMPLPEPPLTQQGE